MPNPDLDRLLSFCIPAAQMLLEKHGEFYPLAATLHFDGNIIPTAIDDGDDKPKPSEMIENFVALFRHFAPKGGLQAVAICYDGRVAVEGEPKKDAITVFLEHSDGDCVTVYLPYRKRKLRGYVYEDVIATAAEPRVFS